jgi:uncharacterized protein (DUF1684 family)
MEVTKWKNMIKEESQQKDIFFFSNYNSPIPFEERQLFEGLDYYPTDPDFRFELNLNEHKEKKILKIEDTKGNEREFFRWGEFRFKVGDNECSLQAYKGDLQEDRLFVPFRDKTNGKETYGADR